MSRIGKKPIDIPEGIKIQLKENTILVEGPKGKLSYELPQAIKCKLQDHKIILMRTLNSKKIKALHGLARALIANMIIGVSQGYTKELEIVGVGFRAVLKDKNLVLNLGFSHPINFPIPQDVKIELPKPTQIIIKGIDKQRVGEVAAEIRSIYPPEPYKGKGIRYKGEYVRKKLGKAVTK